MIMKNKFKHYFIICLPYMPKSKRNKLYDKCIVMFLSKMILERSPSYWKVQKSNNVGVIRVRANKPSGTNMRIEEKIML